MVEAAARLDAGQLQPWGAVLARHQTAGKGRLDRTWSDQAGDSLLATTVAPIAMPYDRVGLIALLAGIAVARALERWGIDVALKWPNDVVLDGRKLGGILIQTRLGVPITVLTGIGLNLGSVPAGLGPGAIALAEVVEAPPSARQVLEAILPELHTCYSKLVARDWNWVTTEWTRRALWLGQRVTVVADREIAGTFAGINSLGQLELITDEGRQMLSSGEITRGPRRLA